ncbi:hypothetical protein [Halomonas sp. RA08-2]|uniref:hypothetical protein n=1 Tax=Halomonas sp. RA08-2 TaxID=3440842 RepID=UPI003EEEBC8C
MQLTIPKAAKLYQKHRSTIHRHIDAGRLSCAFRGDGVRVVDYSELVRCYGEPASPPPELQPDATAEGLEVQQAMLRELQAMRAEIHKLREEVAQLRRLPAPEPSQEPPGEPQTLHPTDDDPHGLRGLVRALKGAP